MRTGITHDERWMERYNEVRAFIVKNQRNPSKYDPEERGRYVTWMKHNRKLFLTGEMKDERVVFFKRLLELCDQYKRKNQYR